MGKGGGGSQSSTTAQKETELSKQQAAILKQREKQYQQYIFPELIEELEEADLEGTDVPSLRGQTQAINRASGQAQSNLAADIAQRGLSGTGVEVQALGSLESARSSALADAYYNAQQAQEQKKMNLLQMGGAMSPTPTTAAPLRTESTSEGRQDQDFMSRLFF